ncbi:MAG: helix-turn-helix domain-containing protein [Myxococcota bacterium]
MASIDIRTVRELGLALRERRRQLGLKQQELADRVGVSRPWIVQVERGKARAELGLVLRTARALGLHLRLEAAPAAIGEGVRGQGKAPAPVRKAVPSGLDVDLDAIIDEARGGR